MNKIPRPLFCYQFHGGYFDNDKIARIWQSFHRLFHGKPSAEQLQKIVAELQSRKFSMEPKNIVWGCHQIVPTPSVANIHKRAMASYRRLRKLLEAREKVNDVRRFFTFQSCPFRTNALAHPEQLHCYKFWATGNGGQEYDENYVLSFTKKSKEDIKYTAYNLYEQYVQAEGYRGWHCKKIPVPNLKNFPGQLKHLNKEISKVSAEEKLLQDLEDDIQHNKIVKAY